MVIYVDADACPVVSQTEELAKKYNIKSVLISDVNHILKSDYSEIITVDKGNDFVDIALINRCNRGDIVVTQDYGVAAMALGKGAYPIHQSGKWYTNENIEDMLMLRHIAKKERKNNRHIKGPKKRNNTDNENFYNSLERLINFIKI